jgi:glycine/sarcosine N-methyltransferase
MTRPLYARFAWAYDSVVAHPAGGTVDQLTARLRSLGLGPRSLVIDAGCGTGECATGLAARGYRVIGVDRSEALIEQARRKTETARFVVGDVLEWRPAQAADAVVCRGMLNDLTADAERRGAFEAFASWLAADGVLLADIRDWESTAARYASGLRHERTAIRPDGTLRFSSETTLEPDRHQMLVHERYVGHVAGCDVDERHDFVMRCWTATEISDYARSAGFDRFEVVRGADADIAADRLLVVARK